ncbi:MAG: calcium-binding protein [Nocardioidaceae bacterium]
MRHLISTSTALATVALALPLIALTGSPAHAETTFDLCSHPGNLIVGTGSADLLVGTAGDDIILGMGGNDVVVGNGGNDEISGGAGVDVIAGGAGQDCILGNDGNDALQGGDDDDYIYGNQGDDVIFGGNGHDYMEGGDGFDSADGYPGDMSCTPQTMTIVKYILAGSDVYCWSRRPTRLMTRCGRRLGTPQAASARPG